MDLGVLVGVQRTWQLEEARFVRDLERNRVARERAQQPGEVGERARSGRGVGSRRTRSRRVPALTALVAGVHGRVG